MRCSATLLWERLRDRAHGREAKPITLADSKPQPDMAIARGRRQDDRGRHPTAEEMLLLQDLRKRKGKSGFC